MRIFQQKFLWGLLSGNRTFEFNAEKKPTLVTMGPFEYTPTGKTRIVAMLHFRYACSGRRRQACHKDAICARH